VFSLVCIRLRDLFQRSHQMELHQLRVVSLVMMSGEITSGEVLDEPFSSSHSLYTDRICSEHCCDKEKLCSW
jgi:hypothetical protein